MKDIIALIVLCIVLLPILGRIIYLIHKRKQSYKKPEKEWYEMKFGNSFAIINYEELKQWNSLSISKRSKIVTAQQKMIRDGLCKIVVVDGEKRLVHIDNYKMVNKSSKDGIGTRKAKG